MPYSFVFDANKCVGCQACVVACGIENGTEPGFNWRNVNTFNSQKQPDLPLFHISLACNHCHDAPCMKNCPALAYSRHRVTGAVLVNPSACIGCTYCTWACPYDAPKLNPKNHIIEKCTLCSPRIETGQTPSCVNLCPTGALGFEQRAAAYHNNKTMGFTEAGIQPSVRIVSLRKKNELPERVKQALPKYNATQPVATPVSPKIKLSNEWSLAVFTFLVSLMFGFFATEYFGGNQVNLPLYIVTGITGMALSSLHLGKKLRAWRAVLNVKNSWLSREIFFFSLFFFSSSLYFFAHQAWVGGLALLVGLFTVFSVDMVYKVIYKAQPVILHSAHITLSALFFTGLLLDNMYIFIPFGLLKLVLFVFRKYPEFTTLTKNKVITYGFRLDFLLSFPLIFYFFDIPYFYELSLVSILIGEIMDRIDFYIELDVITPQKQMHNDLQAFL